MQIGFSTGFMHKEINPISLKAIEVCKSVSLGAIEINCIGGLIEDSQSIFSLNPFVFNDFKHVSLHAPAKVRYGNNDLTYTLLKGIEIACKNLPINIVVFHPDLIDSWKLLVKFDIPYAFENMDYRKKFGTTVKDLKKVFGKINGGFVLDINHCFSIDPEMKAAKDFVKEFGHRLSEIHLSGFSKYHEPLFVTKQFQIMDVIKSLEVPVILEGTCSKVSDVKKEYDFVSEYLGR